MRKVLSFFFPIFLLFLFLGFRLQNQQAQEQIRFNVSSGNTPRTFTANFQEPYFKDANRQSESSNIKDIQVFGTRSGIAYTSEMLFRTDDNGATWRELNVSRQSGETIGGVLFADESTGYAVLIDAENSSMQFAKTLDGGIYWTKTAVNLKMEDFAEADLTNLRINQDEKNNSLSIVMNLTTSSNFERIVGYRTTDEGNSWQRGSEWTGNRFSEERRENLKQFYKDLEAAFPDKVKVVGEIPSENVILNFGNNPHGGITGIHSNWYLTQDGKCEGFKTACWQSTKIYLNTSETVGNTYFPSLKEITPPQIKERAEREKENAKLEGRNSVFAQPPGGTTRISLNRGFDKCTAATIAQMQTWWNNSPFYDVNIYMSGRNRGCSQPQLNAAWVDAVTKQGWGLIPTIVGYQSPCSVSTNSAKHSSDPAVAEQQGRGEADIAVADASALGLTQGTVLYYDMERYDDLSGTGACSTPTKAFLKGWTDRLKELGYISGVYGSPFNANGDWINMPQASQPDVVWLARWNNVMSVWGVAPLPDTYWTNHQRIHQWLGPRNETWGGVTFNIDNNISDAPVAGIAIAKNKRADFDGDGKSDLSIFRPENAAWYVTNSATSSYTILNFGVSGDVLAPGDYDGDGKTDFAVWRPETGVWHIYSRSIYRSSAFGAAGDVPVPADYDGDGRTDLAVFRPSDSTWYIWNSFDSRGTSYTIVQFGLNGDKPVPGDYDGDGKADIAIYRPASGEWWINRSSAGVIAAQFGSSTDKPVQADFSGDGKTDLAFFRPSTGEWFILRSEDASFYSVPFGVSSDIPAVGDYDGDNKADVAVFRPAEGVWYISQSQAGTFITQFGTATDKPVPAAYTP